MDYKDILVFLDATTDTPARVDLAVSIARAQGARLLGVDVSTPAAFNGEFKHQAAGLQYLFESKIGPAGVEGEFRTADRSTPSWKTLYAHFVDLVIATQRAESAANLVLPAVPEDILLSAGVPMLILPSGWLPAPVGESIVVAWSPSREATRAAHDALPLLVRAQRVTLFEFDPPADRGEAAPDLMAEHLMRHGVKAELYTWPNSGGEMSPVNALFACLDTLGADLIVSGAYGHSRFMEGLFGGITRELLHNPAMPLLMSH